MYSEATVVCPELRRGLGSEGQGWQVKARDSTIVGDRVENPNSSEIEESMNFVRDMLGSIKRDKQCK